MRASHRNSLLFFLLGWFLLNALQAWFTELLHDEAYYWQWQQGRPLAFGYFDHPPAIAAFIRLGYGLIPNELGVRLSSILLSCGTLWMLWQIIGVKNVRLFIWMSMGMVIIHVGGFVAVPDIPLIFFATLFYFAYQRYLEKDDLTNSALLVLALTGMAYSKYIGVLAPFFTLLSYPAIMKRRSFWAIVLVTALLYLPHLHWQWVHDFPTFRYHLFDRGQRPWRWAFFWNYLPGQLLIYGPLIAPLLFWAAFRYRAQGRFERALKWTFLGTFFFFLLQSLRKPSEPNWTVVMLIPLLYFGHNYIKDRPSMRKWLVGLAIPSVVLILIFRLYLAVNFFPELTQKRNEFHGWERWAEKVSELAGGKPVVFENSYQKAAKYAFYSKQPAHSVNTVDYAGKQHDLWIAEEENLQGQEVFRFYRDASDSLYLDRFGWMYFEVEPSLRYYNRIKLDIPQRAYTVAPDTLAEIEVAFTNPTEQTVHFTEKDSTSLQYCLFWYGKPQDTVPVMEVFPLDSLSPGERRTTRVKLPTPPNSGDHWRFRLSIKHRDIHGRNSNFTDWDVE